MSDANAPAAQTPVVSDNVDGSNQTPEHVPYTKFRDLLDEKKKEQSEKRALADRIAEFEARDKSKEEELARKRGDFDKIIAGKDEELKAAKAELDAGRRRQQEITKLSAFLKTAGADVDQKWLSLVDTKSIILDPTSGEVDQMSVAQTVDNFKKNWPEAFKKPGATIPTAAPNGGTTPGKITESAWKKLPAADMKKYRYDQIEFGQ